MKRFLTIFGLTLFTLCILGTAGFAADKGDFKPAADEMIGTWSPAYPLELETTGIDAVFTMERTSGATGKMSAGTAGVQFGALTDHKVHLVTGDGSGGTSKRITVDNSNGYVGISDTTPDYPLDMGTIGNNARCTTGGTWQNGSSRVSKENIHDLTLEEAMETVAGLNPVKFNYKAEKNEQYVGFISEDVPELVATYDRKTLSTMDIVAVLTKVVQEQQKLIRDQQKISREQQKTISDLKAKVSELEKK
jgi:hypothetical protein